MVFPNEIIDRCSDGGVEDEICKSPARFNFVHQFEPGL